AVMDSPMFHDDGSGRAMLAGMVRRFEADYEIDDVVRPGAGYLTFASLDGIAKSLGARARFIPSRGSIGWRVRRQIGRIRLRRAPRRRLDWGSLDDCSLQPAADDARKAAAAVIAHVSCGGPRATRALAADRRQCRRRSC